MTEIEIKHGLQKGRFKLDVDTRIPATGITGVFGESGCGKTTLLRCIAGLENSSSDDRRPAHQRGVGIDHWCLAPLSVNPALQRLEGPLCAGVTGVDFERSPVMLDGPGEVTALVQEIGEVVMRLVRLETELDRSQEVMGGPLAATLGTPGFAEAVVRDGLSPPVSGSPKESPDRSRDS